MVVAGSGPNYGTAMFAAAKMAEAAGILAAGQDLEEWCHVERYAYPAGMPVAVIAPPGSSHQAAADVAATAGELGRHVIAVTHQGHTDVTRHASTVLPVHGDTREEFTPLLYHVFASYLASFTAHRLGRRPFQAGHVS
jgi:glutamine---fructose-6-phosphate transaminase (isomerizing)